MKPTAERVLDVAEQLFAAQGYRATALGDVAAGVGIRSPSLYNHFRNKEALYHAVLNRLLDRFSEPLRELQQGAITRDRIRAWQTRLVRMHIGNPNLARLLQHEALADGPGAPRIIEQLFRPLVASSSVLSPRCRFGPSRQAVVTVDRDGVQQYRDVLRLHGTAVRGNTRNRPIERGRRGSTGGVHYRSYRRFLGQWIYFGNG